MSIIFDWYENPKKSEDEKTLLHARPVMNGKVTTKQVAARIHSRCSLTKADVNAVLCALSEVVGIELSEGRQVHLEGLGFFNPTLKLKEPVTRDMGTRAKNSKVLFKGVKFRMDTKLRESIGNVKIEMSTMKSHSARYTEEEMDRLLNEYFKENEVLTRSKFQTLCRLTQSTAILRLRSLKEAGKLKNLGTARQPIYVPAPGYYGKKELK